MLRFSWLIFGADILSLLGNTSTSYDMHFSYAMLFVLLIHLNEWFESRKNSYLLFSLLEMTLILIFGSRGALVCFMVFVAFRICFSSMGFVSLMFTGTVFTNYYVVSITGKSYRLKDFEQEEPLP